MLFLFFIFIVIVLFITSSSSWYNSYNQRKLWLATFLCNAIFTILSDTYVSDPYKTYFISLDQTFFYEEAILLSEYSCKDIFLICFFNFEYSEARMAFALFAILTKLAKFLEVSNILLFLKFHVAFLASLIPVIIYKIILLKKIHIPNLYSKLLCFSLLSPLFIYSCQLLRDIHICLLFTIIVYISLCPKLSLRYFWFFLIIVLSLCFRIENGLFAILFIAIPLYRTYCRIGRVRKIVFWVIIGVVLIFVTIPIFEIMNNTIIHYSERSSDAASLSSLGNKLNLLPFPFGNLAKTCFSQLLPFPFWLRLVTGESYAYLRIVESLFPIYWIPIWMSLIYGWWRYHKKWDRDLLILFYISILYIVLNSSGELNSRRLMAVYPAILICFILLQQQFPLKKVEMNKIAFFVYIFLHIIYLFAKF